MLDLIVILLPYRFESCPDYKQIKKMKAYNHIIDRNLVEWTSFGKYHNEPPRKTLIKDLSDSHLMRIREWMRGNLGYTLEMINFIEQEIEYRAKNYIFVPDTY